MLVKSGLMMTKIKVCFRLRFLVFLFILSYSRQLSATTTAFLDSLHEVLRTTNNTKERLNILYTLSFEYGFSNPEKGKYYGRKCLELALKENNLEYQLNAYNGIANSFETLSVFDSALFYHNKSLDIAKVLKSDQNIALAYVNTGLCYKQLGLYERALKQYLRGLKIMEKDTVYNYRVHFYFGEIYLRLGEYELAAYHSNYGISKLWNTEYEYVAYCMKINLAYCDMQKGNTDSAIQILNDVINRLKKNVDAWCLAMAYKALGKAYLLKDKHQNSAHYFRLSLEEFEALNNNQEVLLALLNLAEAHSNSDQVNQKLVRDYLSRFESILPQAPNNQDGFLEVYQTAARVYEHLGEFNKALFFNRSYFGLRDKILGFEKDLQIQEIQIKYDTDKKEHEIKQLKQDEELMNLRLIAQEAKIERRNYLVIIVCLFMAFAAVILRIFIKKQREKAMFEKEMAIKLTEEKERLRMAKDLHDDLGSGLSKISFLSKRIPSVNTETESEYVNTIAETAESLIVNMRELIWVLTPENITIFGLISRIREFTSDFLEDFPIDVELNVANQLADFSIHSEAHRQILMIVKEVLNNCVKHAQASKLKINLKVDSHHFHITFEDNGVGIPENHRKGNGLINMESRTVKLCGQFDVHFLPGRGTKSAFTFPLASLMNIEVTT